MRLGRGVGEYVRAEGVETKPMRLVNLTSNSYRTRKKMYAVKERTEEEKKMGNLKIIGMLRNTFRKGITTVRVRAGESLITAVVEQPEPGMPSTSRIS